MTDRADAVSVAIFSGAEVLLVQRARAPFKGYWTLPGGKLEAGETEEDGARREIAEELGLALTQLVPVTIIDTQSAPEYRLAVFAARITQGAPVPSDEIADWCWARPEEIGDLRTTPGLAGILRAAAV